MGYVVNRKHRWYAVSYEGTDPLTGADQRRWHRTSDEYTARALAETLPSSRAANGQRSHGVTVARFLRTRWLPANEGRLRPTTTYRYRQMTEQCSIPRVGRVPLRRLTTTQLHDLYRDLLTSGRSDGGGLAPKTVLNVHQILRTALGHAEREGLVARNVARLIAPPCHGTAPEQRCFNANQLRAFLDVAVTHRLGPALWLAAMTGMRRGEVIGLRWDDIDIDIDIDIDASTLAIRRSVTCTGYQVHTTATKTRTSRRCVDLDAATVQVLNDWQARQAREHLRADIDVVFTRPDGQPLHPHTLSQTFERLSVAAGVPTSAQSRPPPHPRHPAPQSRCSTQSGQ